MSNTKHYPTHPGAEHPPVMTCDELTPIELECNMGKDINGVEHREPWKAYDIDEVDALVAEKNKEITELRDESAELHNRIATLFSQIRIRDERIDELKAKMESVQATAYAESVDAGMDNRRLKRALWLARAERARWQSLYYWYATSDKYKSRKFDEVERKCRAKAEQYK